MTGTLAIIVGVIIVIGAIALLIKRLETRMVLIGAGFLMAILALKPMTAFTAFSTQMVNGGLILSICSSLAFAAVLQLSQCDKHLVFSLAKGLKYIRPALIPAVALATFIINISIPSAAGCAAATGVIMIPLMISQGVHPATAASAIMLGTIGSNLSPGLSHNPVIAGLAETSLGRAVTSVEIIQVISLPNIISLIIGAVCLMIVAKILKEDKGYVPVEMDDEAHKETQGFKVNPLFAILPLVPIVVLIAANLLQAHYEPQFKEYGAVVSAASANVNATIANAHGTGKATLDTLLLLLSSPDAANTVIHNFGLTFDASSMSSQELFTALNIKANPETVAEAANFMNSRGWLQTFGVAHAMLLGAFLCMAFTRTNPVTATKDFFGGMGKGYGDVVGIIIAAGVFVGGMNALGMIDAAVIGLKSATSIAGLAATFGPFILGIVSGSGDAAAIAFNGAVTPHATSFGFEVANMGSLAAITGSLGRTMSPLAGAAIICASLAKVNPFEIAKRNALGMVLATIVSMIILLYPSWVGLPTQFLKPATEVVLLSGE